ncbi:MAG: helix-turn-helix domain-containing protein, partial [Lachnospiraceae bacterium]
MGFFFLHYLHNGRQCRILYREKVREVTIMEVRELRMQTGLSQSKFAKMFDVPVSTLKDWEQERRNPPAYVINMMRTI